jgi:hypothetical protein
VSSFFPAAIDNAYRGRKLGLGLLAFVLFFKVAQVISVIFGGAGIIAGADGIPLDTFSTDAARTVVAVFLGSGVSRLLICILCAMVLWRYHSSIRF